VLVGVVSRALNQSFCAPSMRWVTKDAVKSHPVAEMRKGSDLFRECMREIATLSRRRCHCDRRHRRQHRGHRQRRYFLASTTFVDCVNVVAVIRDAIA
jgi:hypothetical protein